VRGVKPFAAACSILSMPRQRPCCVRAYSSDTPLSVLCIHAQHKPLHKNARAQENCLENRARANNTKATSGIGGPKAVGHRSVNTPKNSHARSAAARGAENELKDSSVRDKRPVTSPATRSRGVGRGGLGGEDCVTEIEGRGSAEFEEARLGEGSVRGLGEKGALRSLSSVFVGARSGAVSSVIRPVTQVWGVSLSLNYTHTHLTCRPSPVVCHFGLFSAHFCKSVIQPVT